MPSLLTRLLLSLLWLLIPLSASASGLTLYAYHLKPPFIINERKQTGLYFDFARYANRKLGASLLKTQYLPRRRLEQLLKRPDFNAAVIGVNPAWFGDTVNARYLWTLPLSHDRDLVVSRAERPIPYRNPDSLRGLRIGLPLGYYYFGIDELAQTAQLKRENAESEEQNLRKLLAGHVDVTIVSESTLHYLKIHSTFDMRQLYIAPQPHDSYDRQIMVSRQRPDWQQRLDLVLRQLPHDPEWQAIMRLYR